MNYTLARLVVVLGLVGQVSSWAADLVPDFRLADVNTNSVRYQSPVSPRDYLLQVSGYYFGWAG